MAAITSTVQTYASSKTLKRVTLTSGTSYTVPSGVTILNVCCIGGGGGGGTAFTNYGYYQFGVGTGGGHGQSVWSTISTSPGASIGYSIGAGGASGSSGGTTSFTGATSASGGVAILSGATAQTQVASIGTPNGGLAGLGTGAYSVGQTGGTGGAGSIIVEYWS
jgi:hypothetical protein